MDPLNVLAVEPFFGGSHRAFLEGVTRHSRHRWTLLTGKPVHWKWRFRSSPLEFAKVPGKVRTPPPDVIFASSMLDLPTWLGFAAPKLSPRIPTVVYFHENQWTYPVSSRARIDFHFGYSNLLSALRADACWFNSEFHRDDFLAASEQFVRRMPDGQSLHDFESLRAKSKVVYPGFDAPPPATCSDVTGGGKSGDGPLTLGWVARWEQDKRPDRFVELVRAVRRRGLDFRLVLAGARPNQDVAALTELRNEFGRQIIHDGFVDSRQEYWRRLEALSVVISTAEHEFFGIAICEAIWAGAAPVLPAKLSYPELVSSESLYHNLEDAALMIERLCEPDERTRLVRENRQRIEPLQMKHAVAALDNELTRLSATA